MSDKAISPKQLEALKLKWDKKLKDSGFEDIEQKDGNLKIWHSHYFQVNYNSILYESKQDYYRLAAKFLHDYEFLSIIDKLIWQSHSEGLSIRDIVTNLKLNKIKVYRRLVHETIQKLAKEMLRRANNHHE